jgi:hypothetical protein
MQAITGIFTSFDDSLRSAEKLRARGIADEGINLLTPHASDLELDLIPATEGEQPGMGKAVGGVVGAAVGTAVGAPLGMAVTSAILPGVGPAIAIGLAASALLGIGGAVGGAAAGGSLENALTEGLPKDEIFVYEDALKQGRTVLIAFADDDKQAAAAREIFESNGAESVDEAREQWWVGMRDAEKEHYVQAGGDFLQVEQEYRSGFEAALLPHTRGSSYDEMSGHLKILYPDIYRKDAFRRGYERGQRYYHRSTNSPG